MYTYSVFNNLYSNKPFLDDLLPVNQNMIHIFYSNVYV